MTVKAFKLTNGDEIIAYAEADTRKRLLETGFDGTKLVNEETGEYIISKVRAVVLTRGPDGGIGFAILPWLASNPDLTFKLPKSMVAFEIEPLKGVEDSYIAQTSIVKPVGAGQMPKGGIELSK